MKRITQFVRTAPVSAWLLGSLLVGCGSQGEPVQPQAGSNAPANTVTPTMMGAAGSKSNTSSSVTMMPSPTPAAGSSAKMPAAGAPAMSTTMTQPVANGSGSWCAAKATFDARCTTCHDGKKTAGAPMALKTFEDFQAAAVSDASKKVYQLVGKRVHDTAKPMPPQQQLTKAEMSSIDDWIAAGATADSDPTCASATTQPSGTPPKQAWPTNCDATYKILSHGPGGDTAPYVVPAGQEIHPKVSVTAPWGNEAVQVIAWRAITQNPKVMHHWILYGGQNQFLVGWAPGKDANAPLPDDVGLDMPGGNLTLDLHYNNLMGTADENDSSGFEACVLKKEHFRAKTATVYQGFSQFRINIPAHSMNVDVTGTCNVSTTQPVTLVSASPHAHTYARHMKFTVERANGEKVVMHDHAFDFNEQGTYGLDPLVQLNTGDKVITTCTFSNDTNAAVTFGENTGNEMCFNFALYYPKGALSCSGGGLPGGIMGGPGSGF